MPARRTIAIVGPADAAGDLCDLASQVAELVGRRGDVVLTGGLGGVMQAAAQGARSAGGVAIGLLPGDDLSEASDALTLALPTGLGELRNALIVRAADGVIAVGGSWGTLSEVALAMRTGTPVVCLRGWRLSDHDGAEVALATATNAPEAVNLLYRAIDARR